MNLKMTDAQKTLYYIAENMKMKKKISDEGYEHFQQAIKALEQQPSDDCVSREQVLYIIKPHINEIISESGRDLNARTNGVLRAIIKLVEGMPPVTPTRGTCKDCKYNVKNTKNTTMCDIGHRFYMRIPDTFYCADFEK